MPSINIKTRLGASRCCKPTDIVRTYITRGATAVFKVDLDSKVYDFDDLYQLTFMLKQGDTIWKFDTFDYEDPSGEAVIGEYIQISEDHKEISLVLPPQRTVDFETTGFEDGDEYNLITYETIVQLEVGAGVPDSSDPVIIEKHPLIGVRDSLYAYYEDRTICSDTLYCSDDVYVKN